MGRAAKLQSLFETAMTDFTEQLHCDIHRGDGYETEMSFPFSSTLIATYKNKQGDVHIASRTIEINTGQFYQ